MTRKQCIAYVREMCLSHGFTLRVGRGKKVNVEGEHCRSTGYLDTETKSMAISKKAKISLILHEACHLLQYAEWGDKKFNSTPDLELEYDCEKRVVELIDRLHVKVNKGYYIKQANAYIMSYSLADNPFETFKRNPNYVKAILDRISDRFYPLEVYKNPPAWFREMCDQYCH